MNACNHRFVGNKERRRALGEGRRRDQELARKATGIAIENFVWSSSIVCPLPIPRIRSLMKTGANFVNAYSNVPICCPSRAELLTGKYWHNLRVASYEDSGCMHVRSTGANEQWFNERLFLGPLQRVLALRRRMHVVHRRVALLRGARKQVGSARWEVGRYEVTR